MSSFARIAAVGLALYLAQLARTEPAATPEMISRWVQQLGDTRFAVREQASRSLWEAGKPAETALQEASRSDDAEVVRRSRDILAKFKWGIYPDTPANIVQLILQYRSGDENGKREAIKKLLEMGSKGYEVLPRLANAEENPDVRRNLFQQVAYEASRGIPAMLAEGKFTAVEEILEMSLAGESELAFRNYAAYLLLRGRLDDKIAHFKARADQPQPGNAAEILTYLYRARGDLPNARMAAEKSAKPLLVDAILYEQGDWKTLAKRPPSEGQEGIEVLGFQAAYQRLAGNTAEFEKAIADVRRFAEGKGDESSELFYVAEALFLNDRPQQAIELLTPGKNPAPAFECLTAQLKFKEAFELADRARAAGKDVQWLDVRWGRVLHNLGKKEEALQVFARLGASIKDAKDLSPFGNLIENEYRLNLKEQAFAHTAQVLSRAEKENPQTWVLAKIFPKSGTAAEVWWKFLLQKNPGEKPAILLKQLQDILDGKVTGKDLAALVQEADQAALKQPPVERNKCHQALAETCQAAGLDELALSYFTRPADAGSPAALLRLGDYLAEKKQWKPAAERYGQAWEKDRTQTVAVLLRGWALTQAGEEKEGRKLMELAHWLPLADEAARYNLAEALAKHGLSEAARQERQLILRIGAFESWYVGDSLRHAAQEAVARKDFLTAAACYERAMLRCLKTNTGFLDTAAYLVVPHLVHRYRARGQLAAGRVDEARRELHLCQTALPGDVDLPIALVPELEKLGRKAEADELFAQAFAVQEKLCADYPQSSWARNSLAWLSARCRRQLDKGLDQALQATKLSPQNPAYIDTLAEIYFQKNDRPQAIALMKQCLQLDGKNDYFRRQLQRFETGNPATDPAEEAEE